MKGIVSVILMVTVVGLLMLFIVGIASNFKAVSGDVLGVMSFFYAVQETFSEIVTVSSLLTWSFAFFGVQGLFLYVYWKVIRLVWVHMPQVMSYFKGVEQWLR